MIICRKGLIGMSSIDKISSNLLCERRFAEAESRINYLLADFPTNSALYFGRLLARKQCVDVYELIRKGFDVKSDNDFYLSLHFATKQERQFYDNLKQIVLEVKNDLHIELRRQYKLFISQEQILEQVHVIHNQSISLKKELLSTINDLENVEKELAAVAAKYDFVAKQKITSIQDSYQNNQELLNRINTSSSVSDNELLKKKAEMQGNLNLCEDEKQALTTLIHSQIGIQYSNSKQKRDAQKRKVEKVLNDLNNLYNKQKKLTDYYSKSVAKYDSAHKKLEEWNFQMVCEILQVDKVSDHLRNIEVMGDYS